MSVQILRGTDHASGVSSKRSHAMFSVSDRCAFDKVRLRTDDEIGEEEVLVDEICVTRTAANLPAAMTLFIAKTYKTCDPQFKPIQTLPQRVLTVPSEPVLNNGRDNQDANLICRVHDKLGSGAHSFTILDLLGTGTFGQVFRCKRQGSKELVAVKVIKNKPAYHNQAKLEIKIAQLLNGQFDPHNDKHIVRLTEQFEHHGHICLVFELLNMSLLDLLTQNQFRGLPLSLVQKYTRQLLTALIVLEDANIIHCDLKPENILLQPPPTQTPSTRSARRAAAAAAAAASKGTESAALPPPPSSSSSSSRRSSAHSSDVKVIDFGSACFEGRTIYSYIQSRFYRSPEVLLGCPYNGAIDMWSLACVCAEMYLGLPLFPGVSQHNQLARIVEMFGNPPDFLIECKHGMKFFTSVTPESGLSAAAAALSHNSSSSSQGKPALQNAPASTKFRLKTPEEYAAETNTEVPVLKKYLKYSQLDDVVLKCFPAHKLKLTPEQKQHELHRRKCFVDFLYGLFRINPFERWTAKQAMAHPFIQGTPFTEPFVPPTDLKLQERKLLFLVNSQQRVPRSVGGTNGSGSGVAQSLASPVVLGAPRVPTNFGGAHALSLAVPPPLPHTQHETNSLPFSSSTAVPEQPNTSAATAGVLELPAEDSPPKPSAFENDERPTLKRGAPVHFKAKAAAAEQEDEEPPAHAATPPSPPQDETTRAPRPSVAVKHKPRRHSFTTRVEQQMLQPPPLLAGGGATAAPPVSLSQHISVPPPVPAPPSLAQQPVHDSRSQAYLHAQQPPPPPVLGGGSWSPAMLGGAHLFSAQQQQHRTAAAHGVLSSSFHSLSSTMHLSQHPQHSQHTHTSSHHMQSPLTPHTPHAPHAPHTQHLSPQRQHPHTAYFPTSSSSSSHILSASHTPHSVHSQQPHDYLPHSQAPPLPHNYSDGGYGAHNLYAAGSYGTSFGSFATSSMQDAHAMTDFGMALLRPDMDEHRRLHSQQSVNSSSGYWPLSLTMQHQHAVASSPHGRSSFVPYVASDAASGGAGPTAAMAYSFSASSSSMLSQHPHAHTQQQQQQHHVRGSMSPQNTHLGLSYESNAAFLMQQQQHQQQQQQLMQQQMQQGAPMRHSPFPSGNLSLRRDPSVVQSPRNKIKELPSFGIIRGRSYSQDSVEIARNLALRSPQLRYDPRSQPSPVASPNVKPSSGSVRRSSFTIEEDKRVEDFSLSREWSAGSDLSTGSAGSASGVPGMLPQHPRSPPRHPQSNSRRPSRTGSESGKIVDALAEWDPFFESDD